MLLNRLLSFNFMVEFKRIKKVLDIAPNILAVVNFPENMYEGKSLPARGYIFDTEFEEIYGNLDNAVEHFVKRTKKVPPGNAKYLLGFVKGKNWGKISGDTDRRDRDIVYMGFELSKDSTRYKTKPYLVKDSHQSKILDLESFGFGGVVGEANISEDMLMIAGHERFLSRTLTFEQYIKNFPKFPEYYGLKYID